MRAACGIAILVAVVSVPTFGVRGAEENTDEALYAEWAAYMEEILPTWEEHRTRWGESLGWHAAPMLRGLLDGYRYSRDEKWLKVLTAQADVLVGRLKVEEGHPGWGHSIVGEALLLEPIFKFIHVARSDAKLSAETRKKAESYLKTLDPAMITKWDEMGRWRETAMGCGTYRDGISLPHNMNAHAGTMLLAAARVTPSAERRAGYLDKARRLARRWKKFLKARDDHYIWHYWDAGGRWDYDERGQSKHWTSLEHRGYGSADIAFVAGAYDHGLVFTREDVEMHCRTFLQEIWNGDDENPEYQAMGTFNPEYVRSGIYGGLARFHSKILELWGKATRPNPRSWSGMSTVPAYLLTKKRGVSFERRNAEWVRDALKVLLAREAAESAEVAPEDEELVR